MARPKQCSSCLYFLPMFEIPVELIDVVSPQYDGWCKHYGEERDKQEKVCEQYCNQVKRR